MPSVLPAAVAKLVTVYDAWIVGSAADPHCDHTTVRDYDVVVSWARWQEAAMLIPSAAVPNTFGGWKFLSSGREVDVWPGDLAWLMTAHKSRWAWHPRTGTRLQVVRENHEK